MKSSARRTMWIAAPMIAIGLCVHLWFVAAAPALDTDQALVLLMARAFAAGEFAVYFWSQNYMAVLEPLLLTPLALAGWATPHSAALVACAITATLAILSMRMSTALGGRRWVAGLLWAIPPAVVVHHHVALYGARLAATGLVLAAFWWGMRRETAWSWVGIGVMVGAAFFGDHLMLPWAAGVAWLAHSKGRLRQLAIGSLPVVAIDTALALATPAFHLAGPNRVESWFATGPHLVGVVLPQLFGFLPSRGPGPTFEPTQSVLPAGWLWLLFAVPGALALGGVAWTLIRHRHELVKLAVAQALLLVIALQLALFLFIGGDGERWSVRYLVPLWPAITVLAAVAVAQWRPSRQSFALLLVLPALHALLLDQGWPPRGADGAAATAEVHAVRQALRESPTSAVWADYWDAYRFSLLAGDSPAWVPLSVIDRRPAARRTAEESGPVAYVLRREDDVALRGVLEDGVAAGIAVRSRREMGRFVLIVTERSIPGLQVMREAPSRRWQMLAALSAGLLFPGMLLAVFVLGGIIPSQARGYAASHSVPS